MVQRKHRACGSVWFSALGECEGQSTFEYALVLGTFLCVAMALAAIWRAGAQGQLQTLAQQAASHVLASLSGVRDIVMF